MKLCEEKDILIIRNKFTLYVEYNKTIDFLDSIK